jgi:hypothetical protein
MHMKKTTMIIATLSFIALPLFGTSLMAEQGGGMVPPDMSTGAGAGQGEYTIPPINPKSLKPAGDHPFVNKEVKNFQGEKLGTIHHVMVDTVKGKDTYAILYLEGKKDQYVPVPTNMLKESETGLILNANKQQLEKGPNFGGRGKSQDFQHLGDEPLNPTTRQGGG